MVRAIKDLDPNFMPLLSAHAQKNSSESRAPEKDIVNIFCGYWTRREGKGGK